MLQLLKDLQNGEQIQTTRLLQEVNFVTKNNRTWADVTLTCPEETVTKVKFWNVTPQMQQELEQAQHSVCDISIQRRDYRNQPGYVLIDYQPTSADITDFLPHSFWDQKKLTTDLKKSIKSIKDPEYRQAVQAIYQEVDQLTNQQLMKMPAAISIHHAFIGGLLTHTLSMYQTAENYLHQENYQYLNHDLLIAGLLLHDLGKALAYTNALDHEMSPSGILLDHIPIMDSLIVAYFLQQGASVADIETKTKIIDLRHMILSHHGKKEYGSPVVPALPEAELLHLIDRNDATMETVKEAWDKVDPHSVSQPLYTVDNMRLLKH